MYAAIEAARRGARRCFSRPQPDRTRRRDRDGADDGRGRARGPESPTIGAITSPTTIRAGRGLTDERLARLLCEEGPDCILEMDRWGVGWRARTGTSPRRWRPAMTARAAPMWISLNTGPAVSKTLRTVVNKTAGIRKAGDILVVDWCAAMARSRARVALHLASGRPGDDRRQGDHSGDRRPDAALPPQ